MKRATILLVLSLVLGNCFFEKLVSFDDNEKTNSSLFMFLNPKKVSPTTTPDQFDGDIVPSPPATSESTPTIPTAPINLQTVSTAAGNLILSWSASTDSDGYVVGYEVSKDKGANWIDSGSDLTHTFTGLNIGTTYQLQVRAKDNEDVYSNVAINKGTLRRLIKKVTSGAYHSFIETKDNKLFVFGVGFYGQLGLGDKVNRTSPVELTDTNIKGKVKKVTLGNNRSFIETTDNKLFVFGGDNSSPVELLLP